MYGMTACASTIGKKGQIDDHTDEKWCQKGIHGEAKCVGHDMTACAATMGNKEMILKYFTEIKQMESGVRVKYEN